MPIIRNSTEALSKKFYERARGRTEDWKGTDPHSQPGPETEFQSCFLAVFQSGIHFATQFFMQSISGDQTAGKRSLFLSRASLKGMYMGSANLLDTSEISQYLKGRRFLWTSGFFFWFSKEYHNKYKIALLKFQPYQQPVQLIQDISSPDCISQDSTLQQKGWLQETWQEKTSFPSPFLHGE